MSYSVKLTPKARKQLQSLPREYLPKIISRIDGLMTDPRPPGVKTLSGKMAAYRVRQGPYRIICEVREPAKLVVVHSVTDRKEAYR